MIRNTRPSSRNSLFAREIPVSLIVLVILGLTLVVRLSFAEGPLFDDSLTIAGDAKALYSFDYSYPEPGIFANGKDFLRELRTLPAESWPITAAVGLLYTMFGVSDLTSVLPALLASLLCAYLIYVLGVQMFDEATGLLAAFLWAVLPLSIFLSINLLPPLPLIAINLLAVAIFFRTL